MMAGILIMADAPKKNSALLPYDYYAQPFFQTHADFWLRWKRGA